MSETIKKDRSINKEDANTTFQHMTNALKEDGLSDSRLAIIEAGKQIIQEVLINNSHYYFSLSAKRFVDAITKLTQEVADERGGELFQKYYYKPSQFVNLFRRIFIKIYVKVRKGNEEIIDEIRNGDFV